MKHNKIISKTLRPYIAGLSTVTIAMLICVSAISSGASFIEKKYNISKNVIFGTTTFASGLIAYFFLAAIFFMHKSANGFANEVVKKYINKKISENPDYQQFSAILNNPNALKRLGALISNQLWPSDQKRIIDMVNNIELKSTMEDIDLVHKDIVKVIEDYASVNPEFIKDIYSALLRENHDMYIKQKQFENAQLQK